MSGQYGRVEYIKRGAESDVRVINEVDEAGVESFTQQVMGEVLWYKSNPTEEERQFARALLAEDWTGGAERFTPKQPRS